MKPPKLYWYVRDDYPYEMNFKQMPDVEDDAAVEAAGLHGIDDFAGYQGPFKTFAQAKKHMIDEYKARLAECRKAKASDFK